MNQADSQKREEIGALSDAAFYIPPPAATLNALPYTIPLQLAAWHIAQAKLEARQLA